MSRKVLIIEDDRDIAALVRMHLAELSCDVHVESDGRAGLAAAQSIQPDLVILDVMLPGIDGLEICRRIRATAVRTRVLMLTAKSTEFDRVLGLELGADDYLTKPFSIKELVARVQAMFRRIDEAAGGVAASTDAAIVAGSLVMDVRRRIVTLAGKQIELTTKEFDLLLCFARHPGMVFTRAQLLDKVWGYSHRGYEHTVNSHINRLRGKIERNPDQPQYIQTVWGVGYRFADTSAAQAAPPGAGSGH